MMVVTVQQFQNGVTNFVEKEVAMKAIGIKKFITYFMLASLPEKVEKLYKEFIDSPIGKEYFDDNGNVDIDLIHNYAKQAIQKSGKVEYMNVILDEADVDNLYNYILRG